MKDWNKLFLSYTNSGIVSIRQSTDINAIRQAAVSRGLAFFEVDLSTSATKEDFLSCISETLKFPSYFGMNWDALEECLKDMEWCNSAGYVIVLNNPGVFSHKAPEDFKMLQAVLKSAAQYWKSQQKPFYVILLNR